MEQYGAVWSSVEQLLLLVTLMRALIRFPLRSFGTLDSFLARSVGGEVGGARVRVGVGARARARIVLGLGLGLRLWLEFWLGIGIGIWLG